jgi:hypothetical protein
VSALTNTTSIRLYHSDAPNFPNPNLPIFPILAQLGVDNIQAGARTSTSVPENGWTSVLFLPTFLTAAYFKRRSRAF